MNYTVFPADGKKSSYDGLFSMEEALRVQSFHKTLADYQPTPLRSLQALSQHLGLGSFSVKDESFRFGLNAFKGLGGSYALARILSEKTGIPMDRLQEIPENTFTFATATDGNHGRGIAWAARNLRQKAVVYMPKGSVPERLANIRAQGATAEITEYDYDSTVRFVSEQAQKNGWILVQDTAWEGYEKIPLLIMQGYLTMGLEAFRQLGEKLPTHIFLQAGVGSMAAAIAAFFCGLSPAAPPKIIIVEPERADCFFQTAKARDGMLHKARGPMTSMMAGLCCGEACTAAWEILRHHAAFYVTCPDFTAALGMRLLGKPLSGDERIVSGESGAVTAGLLYELMTREDCVSFRQKLGLGKDSSVLCFSTEGDTDRTNYRRVVWEGQPFIGPR